MKVNELLNEEVTPDPKLGGTSTPLPARVTGPLPGTFVQKELRNTDPYMQYRYGMAVAAAMALKNGELDSKQYEQESEFAENLTQVAFTQEEEEIIRLASKLMGVTPKKISGSESTESKAVNKVSPVAAKKKNKYGV